MQLSNNKLVDRGIRMIIDETDISYDTAKQILEETGSVRLAINKIKNG